MSRAFRRLSVMSLWALVAPGGIAVPPIPVDEISQSSLGGASFLSVRVKADADDGTEVNDSVWHEDGYAGTELNRMGFADLESYDVGLRFSLPTVCQGETFVYARLVLAATDDGQVDSTVKLRIVGVDQDSPAGFDVARPSQLPKTEATVDWELVSDWPAPTTGVHYDVVPRHSPDLSSIINEIVSRPGWGSGSAGKTLALVIEDNSSSDTNFLTFHDFLESGSGGSTGLRPVLELYRTVRSTFLGKELLGRPTDHSVTVNAISLLTLRAYFEYGPAAGPYTNQTAIVTYPGETPIEVVLDGLSANTAYDYRIRYRRPGESPFQAGPRRSFHTQRSVGDTFCFTVTADSHLQWQFLSDDLTDQNLYRLTLQNAGSDNPDFHVDLGDTFECESYVGHDAVDYEDAVKRHLDQRPFLDLICHSAPFFFVLGNHEGEQGWRLDGTPDNLAVWAANARKLVYPLPVPDGFYTGNVDEVEFVGLREDYYAWEWGDALFVVLDPFWYTTTKPHNYGGVPGSGDNWDWTLGQQQFEWLEETLQSSSATFKFVFAHHVTGGVTTYGRGGVEAASHALGGRGSFEWGGEDLSGDYVFDVMRPGWGDPIHQLMVANNVSIFFHGHDHVFVKQELDGVVYQECPQPADVSYGAGFSVEGCYWSGDRVNNSGHLRVTVSPFETTADYIRAYLPGDGTNGELAYSYTVPAPGAQ